MAASLTALQLESSLKGQTPAPIYLIVGDEDLLRDTALAQIKEAVLGGMSDFNFDQYYGDEAHGSDIVACASEMPVFAERRLVVVKAADKLPARQTEALVAYLKEPNDTTTLVFVCSKLDGRLKFSQTLARSAVTIDCSPLRDAQLTPWLSREAGRLGVNLEAEAGQMLRDMSGGSLYGIRRELEKLAAYVPAGVKATAADVALLRGIEPGASVFDLAGAIADVDRARVLRILARNLDAGEAPLRILGSLAWQYRRIWKVKELLKTGGREGEAARTLRMDPARVRTFLGRFTDGHLQGALQLFLETDGHLKGGRTSDPRVLMERLLLRLCDYATRPAGGAPAPARSRTLSNVRTIKSGGRTGRSHAG